MINHLNPQNENHSLKPIDGVHKQNNPPHNAMVGWKSTMGFKSVNLQTLDHIQMHTRVKTTANKAQI